MTRLLLAACAMAWAGLWAPVPAQVPGQQLYVVTHVDLAGAAAAPEGTRLLLQFVMESRKDPGAVRIELLVEPTRLNHLTLVEVWQTRANFDAHLAAPHAKVFRDKLQPLLGSPFDERLHVILP